MEFFHSVQVLDAGRSVSRVDGRVEVDLVRGIVQVVENVEEIIFVHPAAHEKTEDTVGKHESVSPEFCPHVPVQGTENAIGKLV